MKVIKNGRAKLDFLEIRVGNFFVKKEVNHMKITDLNGVFSFRVGRRMPLGVWMDNMFERGRRKDEGAINTLHVYISTMWSLFSVAPDDGFIKDVLRVTEDALNRHPDWYGIKVDATEEEDARATREVREMKEFESEVTTLVKEGE